MAKGSESLRFFLRDGTRAAHEETDAAFGVLDLTTVAGLAGFLEAHYRALCAIEPYLDVPGLPEPPRRLGLIEADLRALGRPVPPPLGDDSLRTHRLEERHPLGLAYVVGGSALGGRVLRRAWELSAVPEVQGAGRYIRDENAATYWVALQTLLSRVIDDREEAAAMLVSARMGFSLFTAALGAGGGELWVRSASATCPPARPT